MYGRDDYLTMDVSLVGWNQRRGVTAAWGRVTGGRGRAVAVVVVRSHTSFKCHLIQDTSQSRGMAESVQYTQIPLSYISTIPWSKCSTGFW